MHHTFSMVLLKRSLEGVVMLFGVVFCSFLTLRLICTGGHCHETASLDDSLDIRQWRAKEKYTKTTPENEKAPFIATWQYSTHPLPPKKL